MGVLEPSAHERLRKNVEHINSGQATHPIAPPTGDTAAGVAMYKRFYNDKK